MGKTSGLMANDAGRGQYARGPLAPSKISQNVRAMARSGLLGPFEGPGEFNLHLDPLLLERRGDGV